MPNRLFLRFPPTPIYPPMHPTPLPHWQGKLREGDLRGRIDSARLTADRPGFPLLPILLDPTPTPCDAAHLGPLAVGVLFLDVAGNE